MKKANVEPSEGGTHLSSPNNFGNLAYLSVVCSSFLFSAEPFLLPLLFFPLSFKKETRRRRGLVLLTPSHYTLLLCISLVSLHLLWRSWERAFVAFLSSTLELLPGRSCLETLSRDPRWRPLGGLP